MTETLSEHADTQENAPETDNDLGGLRVFEAVAVLLLFGGLLYASMRPESGWTGAAASGAVIGIGLGLLWLRRNAMDEASRRMWTGLFALAAGFWIFNAFRRAGVADWPVHRVISSRDYATLLYMHFALLMTMAAAAAWAVYRVPRASHFLRWGSWRRGRVGRLGQAVLVTTTLGVWIWAALVVWRWPLDMTASFGLVVSIALLKAAMAALIEEGCYRGVVLPLASARLSVGVAIVLQACMYGVFHAFLTPGMLNAPAFVAVAFALGLLFGVVTHFTKGIGWAVLTHSAIAMVIEWQNLS